MSLSAFVLYGGCLVCMLASISVAHGQEIGKTEIQFAIDSLLQPPGKSREYEVDGQTKTFTKFWDRMEADYYFSCFGDICSEKRYGLISVQNQDTLDPLFPSIEIFQDKIFLVHEQWAALTDDQLKVTNAFEDAALLSKDYLKALQSQHWGVLDSSLREVLPFKYEDIRLYRRGFGFADEEKLIPYFLVREDGKWGMIKPNNEVVVPIQYEGISPLPYYAFLAVKKGKYALMRSSGQLLSPFKYDTVYSDFSMTTFVVGLKNRLGLLSMGGKEVTPLIYTAMGKVGENGCRCARKDGKWGIISSTGKELTAFIYEDVKWYDLNQIPLRKNSKWGFYDCKNKRESTPFIYEKLEKFYGFEADVLLNGISKRIKLE